MNGGGADHLNADQRELIENFETLDPLRRAMLLTIVKAFRDEKNISKKR